MCVAGYVIEEENKGRRRRREGTRSRVAYEYWFQCWAQRKRKHGVYMCEQEKDEWKMSTARGKKKRTRVT